MASLTKLIFETDGKKLSPVASDADYDIYDGENGSMNISVHLLDGWESMGCVVECQNVNTGKKDMGGTRAGNVLNYTVNASLLTTGKLAFHLRGTDGDTIIKTDDWFVDVYRSFDVADGMEPIEPTQYDQLSGQIGALEGQFGNLLDEIENGEFDGYSANWSAQAAVIPTDGEELTLTDFSMIVSLVLKKGERIITDAECGYTQMNRIGYSTPTVTVEQAQEGESARWRITLSSGSKLYPQDVIALEAIAPDGYTATNGFSLAAARQGATGATGETGAAGEKGETGATPKIGVGGVYTTDPGGDAVVSCYGTDEEPKLYFWLPRGATGPQGPQGEQGEKGADGPQGEQGERGATGEQGPAGADGVSPSVTVDEIENGHRVTFTDATGEHSFDVMDGESGGGGGATYEIGDGLKLDTETNTLSVDTTDKVEENNNKPITSSAVYLEIGNINVKLSTI